MRDQVFLAIREDVDAPKAPLKVIGTHIVVARHNDHSLAIAADETLREPDQKIERFLILLPKRVLRVRLIRSDALNNVAADDDQVW